MNLAREEFVLALLERYVQAEESKARSLEKLAELPEALYDVAAAIEIASETNS